MARRRRTSSRSTRYPIRWPSVLGWSAGLALSAATLALLTYLAGRTSRPDPASPFEAVLVAASRPGIALAITCGALVSGASCVRHLMLHWLAWRPGRIEVATFTAGTRLTDADVDQLTMNFRRRLVTLHLQAPTPVPGAAPEGDFLDVLGRNGVDAKNVLGTLINVLRAATPTHAYEVRGTLLERPARPRYGVTVHVLRLPSEGALPVTVWGETWDVALRMAADEATAAILPQTRRCRAPWGVWRGHVMPAGLLHAFEEGARFEHERRYDEALGAYYRAVEIDPMNMPLRLRIGQLQERLGLYLDALATYWGMWETARPAGARRSRFWHRGPGRRERSRALISARYRRNVLLGGRLLAQQWHTVPDDPANPTERDEQRQRLRACLRPRLKEKLRGEDPEAVHTALEDPVEIELASDRFLQLRELLADYALRDCRRLRGRLRLHFHERATLTCATVRLTELCMRIRRDWVRQKRATAKPDTWPPKPRSLTRQIRRIERGRPFRRWHEHYNAACAYALPLLDQQLTDPADLAVRELLTDLAVARLQKATARADSAFIASRRDWLLSEDPDLKGLRVTHEFGEFELMYLPSDRSMPRRPRHVRRLESSRYVQDLLLATAQQWHTTWHRRGQDARRGGVDIHLLLEWFDEERRAWKGIRKVARNYRHSASRLALIRSTRECADRYGFEPLEVGFPRYHQAHLAKSARGGHSDDACADAVSLGEERLQRVSAILRASSRGEAGALVLDELERWLLELRRLDTAARPVPLPALERICSHHAALWQLLGQWLEASVLELDRAEADFVALVQAASVDGLYELCPQARRAMRAVAR